MSKRDPLKFPRNLVRMDTLGAALKKNDKKPFIGVTQGGSSRKSSGAKPAATKGEFRPTKAAKFKL